jgi:hypothetical protein
MVNPGDAISAQGLGDCTAEALRARSKEFLIKNTPNSAISVPLW